MMLFYQKISTHKLKISLIFIIILTLHTLAAPVLATGPGKGGSKLRMNEEVHGPYKVSVATGPLPIIIGQMSVWVQITNSDNETIRRNATVIVEAIPLDGGSPQTVEASHKNAGNIFDYVAHVDVDQSGEWLLKISIEDELGSTEVMITETVSKERNNLTLIALAIPLIIGVVVAGVYLWKKSGEYE